MRIPAHHPDVCLHLFMHIFRSWCIFPGRRRDWGRISPSCHRGTDHSCRETQGSRTADSWAQRDMGGQTQENRNHSEREVTCMHAVSSSFFEIWPQFLKTYICIDSILTHLYVWHCTSMYSTCTCTCCTTCMYICSLQIYVHCTMSCTCMCTCLYFAILYELGSLCSICY